MSKVREHQQPERAPLVYNLRLGEIKRRYATRTKERSIIEMAIDDRLSERDDRHFSPSIIQHFKL